MPGTAKPFVDFRRVKAAVPIDRVLARYGVWHAFGGSGAQYRGPCPIHRGTEQQAFTVDLERRTWTCAGACNRSGDVVALVAAMEGCRMREAALLLADWFAVPLTRHPETRSGPAGGTERGGRTEPNRQNTDETGRPAQTDVNHPPPFERLAGLAHDHEALIKHGLLSDTAAHFGVGYADSGLMRGRIAIPVHSPAGRLLAYAGADPDDPEAPYRWPNGFRPELEVYNAHRAAACLAVRDDALVIVDDFFPVFALYEAGWENVVALIGGGLSGAQLAKLQALLAPVQTPRIMWAFRRERRDDRPPYETIGRLSEIAWVLALPLTAL